MVGDINIDCIVIFKDPFYFKINFYAYFRVSCYKLRQRTKLSRSRKRLKLSFIGKPWELGNSTNFKVASGGLKLLAKISLNF